MKLGAHESTAGGVYTAFQRGAEDGCEALQIFTASNVQWNARDIDEEEASLFRGELEHYAWPVMTHASYLINLASPDGALWSKSLESLWSEVERCELLGIDFVVFHPGSHVGDGEANGLRRVAAALKELADRARGYDVQILVENTAGQGSNLGYTFEHLHTILDDSSPDIGVCIDTCHAFAAGYDFTSLDGYNTMCAALERAIGLNSVRAFHLNDSKHPCKSRLDRHATVGEGQIGLEAFRLLVNDSRFVDTPAVVETPPLPDGSPSFAHNLHILKGLRRSG